MTIEDPTFDQMDNWSREICPSREELARQAKGEYHPVCEECLAEIGFEAEDLCVGFSSANCETCGCQRSRRDLVCLDTESFRRYREERASTGRSIWRW